MTTASISVAANPISERVGRLIAFVVCVIAVNNVSILWRQANPGRTVIADIAFIAMWLAVAAWILYVERLAPRQIGLVGTYFGARVMRGALVGCVMGAIGIAVAFMSTRTSGAPIPITSVDPNNPPSPLLLAVMLVIVAVTEEVMFRGLIQTQATAWLGTARGIGLSATLFALWHIAVTALELGPPDATVGIALWLGTFGGKLLILAGAGLIFSWLRASTGSLVAPMAAHWTVDFLLLGTVLYVL